MCDRSVVKGMCGDREIVLGVWLEGCVVIGEIVLGVGLEGYGERWCVVSDVVREKW